MPAVGSHFEFFEHSGCEQRCWWSRVESDQMEMHDQK